MIKAIILDLNKVLITYNKADEDYIKKLGVTREEFWQDREVVLKKYALGQITLDEYLLHFIKKAGLTKDMLEVVKEIHEKNLAVVEGMKEVIEELSKKFILILMAGEGKEVIDLKLDKFGLRKYFNKIYATSYQRMEKTDMKFYQLILAENHLRPGEALFVDDRPAYIECAKKVGLKTILFEDSKSFRKEFQNLTGIKA